MAAVREANLASQALRAGTSPLQVVEAEAAADGKVSTFREMHHPVPSCYDANSC